MQRDGSLELPWGSAPRPVASPSQSGSNDVRALLPTAADYRLTKSVSLGGGKRWDVMGDGDDRGTLINGDPTQQIHHDAGARLIERRGRLIGDELYAAGWRAPGRAPPVALRRRKTVWAEHACGRRPRDSRAA